jgi:hypothetical protein
MEIASSDPQRWSIVRATALAEKHKPICFVRGCFKKLFVLFRTNGLNLFDLAPS